MHSASSRPSKVPDQLGPIALYIAGAAKGTVAPITLRNTALPANADAA